MCLFFLAVPAAPTNLSLTNPGSSSKLYTSWNKPPGSRDHYRITLYSLSTQSRIQVQTLSADALNCTWTHLEAGSKFAVQVTAVKGSLEASSTNITQWTCESACLGWAPCSSVSLHLSLPEHPLPPSPSQAMLLCNGPTSLLTALTPSLTQSQSPHPPQRLWLSPLPHPAADPRDDTVKVMCLAWPFVPRLLSRGSLVQPAHRLEDPWAQQPALSAEQEGELTVSLLLSRSLGPCQPHRGQPRSLSAGGVLGSGGTRGRRLRGGCW